MQSLYARLSHRFAPERFATPRRDLLKVTLAASAGLLLSGPALGMGSRPLRRPSMAGKRVVVVGAGFSGLTCAHELMAAGYDVTVLESRDRVGGRVLTFSDMAPGRNAEGGGELIGSNHPMWVAYAEKFGLEWLDVSEYDDHYPIILGGKSLSAEEAEALWEEMDAAYSNANSDAEAIDADQPWLSPNAIALDKKTTKDWLDGLKDISPLCRLGIAAQLQADNGADPARQSYLGNLAQIKGGGVEKYWTDSEVYRCKGGNQQLAFKLAEAIGKDRIITGLAVTAIAPKGSNMVVTGADGRTLECDDVVLSVPPSVWRRIEIKPGLGTLAPQMGVNVKYLTGLKTAFWKGKGLAPDAFSDGEVNMTWDNTDNQEGEGGAVLTAFSGGPDAEMCMSRDGKERDAAYAKELEALLPGYTENFVKSRMMDWPKDKWTMGSYSFPAPGQVTTVGPVLRKGMGKMHFAGEHTCYAFVGYMEGALSSGAAVARRLAERDGLSKPTPKAEPKPELQPEPATVGG